MWMPWSFGWCSRDGVRPKLGRESGLVVTLSCLTAAPTPIIILAVVMGLEPPRGVRHGIARPPTGTALPAQAADCLRGLASHPKLRASGPRQQSPVWARPLHVSQHALWLQEHDRADKARKEEQVQLSAHQASPPSLTNASCSAFFQTTCVMTQ